MNGDMSERRLLQASAIIENAPYLLHAKLGERPNEIYGAKCASSQSQNCPRSKSIESTV